MCGPSCMLTTAYMLLVLSLLAAVLAYVAPFWILFPNISSSIFAGFKGFGMYNTETLTLTSFNWWTAGLWAACTKDDDSPNCGWFFQNDFYAEKNLPDWHKACQGLFGGGIILLFIAVLMSSFNLCCRCCKESFSITSVLGCFIVTGSICIGLSVGLYGGFMTKDYDVRFDDDTVMFYWAFFVGVAAAALSFASALIYFCMTCRRGPSHSGYKMTRVV